MKKIHLVVLFCLLLAGCTTYEKLPAQRQADLVTITTLPGFPELPRKEIRGADQIAALVSFVNSLPNRWNVPWAGPPVGQVNFEFYSHGKFVGNFYVGPNFFGRDAGNFWSQSTDRTKIVELGKIVELDLLTYIDAKKP